MMVRSVAMNIKMTMKSAWPHQHSTGIMAVMEVSMEVVTMMTENKHGTRSNTTLVNVIMATSVAMSARGCMTMPMRVKT